MTEYLSAALNSNAVTVILEETFTFSFIGDGALVTASLKSGSFFIS